MTPKQRAYLDVLAHQDPDIFEVIFKDKSRKAVDEYIEVLLEIAEYIREQKKFDHPVHILIDVNQSGLYPLQYALASLKPVLPSLADIPPAYFVYLTDSLDDRVLIERFTFLPGARKTDERQVYNSADRDQAIKWLLSKTK